MNQTSREWGLNRHFLLRFNPVAVTIMKKALIKVLDKIYSSSSATSILPFSSRPSDKTLEIIIAHSNGDIRSALMSLEFLSSNPAGRSGVTTLAAGESGTKKGKKRKSDGKEVGRGANEEQVKQL